MLICIMLLFESKNTDSVCKLEAVYIYGTLLCVNLSSVGLLLRSCLL